MSLTIFYNDETPFQAIKKEVKKFKKMDIFPNRLTHGFGPKMAIFPNFFLGNISNENDFYDILEKKRVFGL